jgi:hypothetical protein
MREELKILHTFKESSGFFEYAASKQEEKDLALDEIYG